MGQQDFKTAIEYFEKSNHPEAKQHLGNNKIIRKKQSKEKKEKLIPRG